MRVRCASCGWLEFRADDRGPNAIELGARHLRECPRRDDLTLLPWWTRHDWGDGNGEVFEVGWHPADMNEPFEIFNRRVTLTHWHLFTDYAERELIKVHR